MADSVARVSEQTVRIQRFLEVQAPGAELSYDQVGHECGLHMDDRGKQYLRSALHRAKLEYSVIMNYGIKLADARSTMPLLVHRLGKIDRAVKRADRSQKNLQEQFFSTLTDQEQKELLYVGAVFGAIRVAADNGRIIYSRKREISGADINIRIPKM